MNWVTNICLTHHIHLTSRQPTTTSSSISKTFCRENAFTTSSRQKMLSKSSSNPEALTFFFLKHKILFGNCLKQKIPCQERPGGKWFPNRMEFQDNESLKGHERETALLLFEKWLVTCILWHCYSLNLSFPSLHNSFIIKYLLATHISSQQLLFIHPQMGSLGYLHILIIMNNITRNIRVQVSL